jgi:hypothetical protein
VVEGLLLSANYTPRKLSSILGSFIGWYLATGEVHCVSSLQGMCGMHFSPVGHPAFQTLMKVRQVIEVASKGLCKGTWM